ncbi:hypothetical protein U879_17620 [Defluviimonas sp. 20V17]|uniref:Transposase IS4-like domain-containing protein n=1 Tax=Allgaiera indica TaxID=765699 RepID=A0AAN4URV5_9RHOB|nr:hypothetical protein U879_17620 [Defluviimonas sp. 20V17]GHE02204.1 hypothetical protein GCM10008024_20880 [Allgaiera indica]
MEFTSSREGDSPVLPDLLDQIPPDQEIGTVTGDGVFDTRRCHTAILARGGTAIIPIRKNGRFWKEDCPAALGIALGPMADNSSPRNDILRATRQLGRAIWKRWSGYHVRSRIEAKMPSPVLSNRWRSPARPQVLRREDRLTRPGPPDRRNPDPHHSPLALGPVARQGSFMNRFNSLSQVEIERIV